MAKELLKDTATAAEERLLQSLMPALNARLDAIQKQIGGLQTEIDRRFAEVERRFGEVDHQFVELDRKFERIDEKFERHADLVDELGLRINTVGAKLDAYVDIESRNAMYNRFLNVWCDWKLCKNPEPAERVECACVPTTPGMPFTRGVA